MTELEFALNTFYLLMSGALVMWMAAGFTMLEAGLVRSKNAAEIVTKNLGLFSIACVMYLVCGFSIYFAYIFQFETALIFLLTGVFFDVWDGLFARLLKVESNLGVQLDSMADMVRTLNFLRIELKDIGIF